MANIKKILMPGGELYNLNDARISNTTSEDAGKLLTVNSEGNLEWLKLKKIVNMLVTGEEDGFEIFTITDCNNLQLHELLSSDEGRDVIFLLDRHGGKYLFHIDFMYLYEEESLIYTVVNATSSNVFIDDDTNAPGSDGRIVNFLFNNSGTYYPTGHYMYAFGNLLPAEGIQQGLALIGDGNGSFTVSDGYGLMHYDPDLDKYIVDRKINKELLPETLPEGDVFGLALIYDGENWVKSEGYGIITDEGFLGYSELNDWKISEYWEQFTAFSLKGFSFSDNIPPLSDIEDKTKLPSEDYYIYINGTKIDIPLKNWGYYTSRQETGKDIPWINDAGCSWILCLEDPTTTDRPDIFCCKSFPEMPSIELAVSYDILDAYGIDVSSGILVEIYSTKSNAASRISEDLIPDIYRHIAIDVEELDLDQNYQGLATSPKNDYVYNLIENHQIFQFKDLDGLLFTVERIRKITVFEYEPYEVTLYKESEESGKLVRKYYEAYIYNLSFTINLRYLPNKTRVTPIIPDVTTSDAGKILSVSTSGEAVWLNAAEYILSDDGRYNS